MKHSRQYIIPTELAARLEPFRDVPDGVVCDVKTMFHRAVVLKKRGQLQLFFVREGSRTERFRMSGAMSRIDLDNPLDLVAVYTRAMMLTVVWKPDPRRILVLGLGGGRLAMILHHYYPEAVIDCVELDPAVVDIAETYFAFQRDHRMLVFVQDGREFVETLPDNDRYDIILVDCFTGPGHHPGRLATMDFYRTCRNHLAPGGVLATNIHASDDLFALKAATLRASFGHAGYFANADADVLFGWDGAPFDREAFIHAVDAIQKKMNFFFPLDRLAVHVRALGGGAMESSALLTDESVAGYI